MEEENKKQIKVESIGSSISSILLSAIQNHQDVMTVASLGGVDLEQQEKLNRNRRTLRRAASLPRIINAQQGMVRISLSIIKIQSEKDWVSKYPTESDQKDNPFKKHDNDYNELLRVSEALSFFIQSIREASITNNLDDDFVRRIQHTRQNYAVNDWILTDNFFDMLGALEESFETVYSILLENGLITDITTELKSRSKSSGIY